MSATLAIALIGAVTGVVGLAWQLASFTLTGARVKLWAWGWQRERGSWPVRIRVANRGRLDAYIDGLYTWPSNEAAQPRPVSQEELGKPYPVVLKPGYASEFAFWVPAGRTEAERPASVTVRQGTGKFSHCEIKFLEGSAIVTSRSGREENWALRSQIRRHLRNAQPRSPSA
jgi:hypothetical protein